MRLSLPMRRVAAAMTATMMALSFASFVPFGRAAVTQRNVLIKGSGPAVYYLAEDDKRYVFPNEKTYRTWYSGFGSVIPITDAELATFMIGGNVTYRPGVKMVKIDTDPKVYAVAKNGELRWVRTEALAASLYGSDWNQDIDDVPDAFFVNYHVGEDIDSVTDYSPAAAMAGSPTIAEDKGIKKPVPPQPVPGPVVQPDPITGEDTDPGSVVGGDTTTLARFRLTAVNESLRLTKASFSVETATAVESVSLYDGTVRIAGPVGVDGSGNAHFTNITGFTVPRNDAKTLTVRGTLNEVSPSGTVTGSNAKVTFRTTAGPYSFEMRGEGTSTVVTQLPNGDVAGNDKIVRKSVPSITLGTLPSSLLVNGEVVAMRVVIAADAAGDVAFKTLTARVSKPASLGIATTGDAAHTTMRAMGSGENLTGHSTTSADCAAGVGTSCVIRIQFSNEEAIAAGTSKTYDLRLFVSAAVTGDAISTILEGDAAVRTGALTSGTDADQVRVNGSDVNVAWSDLSAVPHSAAVGSSSADWASGRYLKYFPTDPQTLSR